MPASLTTVNQITKEIYLGKIRNQLQEEAVGFKRIESSSDGISSEVGGKYVTFPIRTRRNHGIGYRQELEQLPAGGQQAYASVRVPLKYGYGRTRMSGQVMELASQNYQAFANAMDMEMEGLKNDIAKDQNRIFYGDGNGTMATTSAASTGNVLTVANSGTKFTEIGAQIDIVGPGGTIRGANRQITAITATTITFDGAAVATVAIGDTVVRTGSYGREPQGLASLVTNTGTLFNVDPTVEPKWKAVVDSNGGTLRALSENLMITNTDAVRVEGGKTSLILYSLGVRRAYFNLLSQQRRYPSTTSYAGGLTGLAFNNGHEIPCVEDVDAPSNTMFGLDESSFKIYRKEPWNWMDREGHVWKWVTDFDAYEALLHQYWELAVNKRNANFVIKDLAEG